MKDDNDAGSGVGSLGLAGASFAAVLVLASLNQLDESGQNAVKQFAVSIPLAVAAYFVGELESTSRGVGKTILTIAHALLFIVAQFGCAIGIYWVFRHISDEAGATFLKVAIGSYLGAGILFLVALIAGEYWIIKKERRDRRQPTLNATQDSVDTQRQEKT